MNVAGLLVLLGIIAALIVVLASVARRPAAWWTIPVLGIAIALVGIGVLIGAPSVGS